MAAAGDIPHLLFYGISGAGKKTRVLALLKELFGPGAEKIKQDRRVFKTPTNRTVEITTLSSNYHIELNPNDAGSADTFVVQEVIKEIAQFSPLHVNAAMQNQNKDESNSKPAEKKVKSDFKVVFLSEADHLSRNAQHALRRTMEKYVSSCRIIMCCENANKIIPPLRSRCLNIRVSAPTEEEIAKILNKIVNVEEKYQVNKNNSIGMNPALAMNIARHSKRNLRKALLMLQTCKVQHNMLAGADPNIPLPIPDWEKYITNMAKALCQNQNTQVLLNARKGLYDLLANCIPPSIILSTLCAELLRKVDDDLKHDVNKWAAHYDQRMQLGTKDIFHLEAFIAKFMVIYKNH
eukprot:CAMPEP_0204828304 /NCGR_PEP_ID=MMETSP1346-20131115/5995_1 /ASSEMBLY_ACC=CAM_ASM_000771 /TAXON_ID=215587 /ORGANISM="Aplanochytrium stocchinoi, Strain GSBS06" /LENGTH=349 /DNA_ID=CAMNT_0051957259 /DNA_START=202 /DNA_END=1248 /DNA_ORIENTATION=-